MAKSRPRLIILNLKLQLIWINIHALMPFDSKNSTVLRKKKSLFQKDRHKGN
jgi:hypothetical protein